MDFCILLKMWVKTLVKVSVKYWVINTAKNVQTIFQQSATDAPKASSKKVVQKAAERTGNLTGN